MRRVIYPDLEKCAFQPSQDLLQKILRQIAVLVGWHPFGPLEIVAIPMFSTSGRQAALQNHLSPPLHIASVEPAAVYYYILMTFREWLAVVDHTNHILRNKKVNYAEDSRDASGSAIWGAGRVMRITVTANLDQKARQIWQLWSCASLVAAMDILTFQLPSTQVIGVNWREKRSNGL